MGIKGKLAGFTRKGTDYIVNKINGAGDKTMGLIDQWTNKVAQKIEQSNNPVNINPSFKLVLQRVAVPLSMLAMVFAVLDSGIAIVTPVIKLINSVLTIGPLRFEWGRWIAKKLPFGATVVAVLESFGKLIGAVTSKTKEVLKHFAIQATSLMRLRYGEEVARVFQSVLKCFGCTLNMAWNTVQLLDPIGLPFDDLQSLFHQFYENIGIHDIQNFFKEHFDLPEPVEKLNEVLAFQALALEQEKKKKKAAFDEKVNEVIASQTLALEQEKKKKKAAHDEKKGAYDSALIRRNAAQQTSHYDTPTATYQTKQINYGILGATDKRKPMMVLA